jgi:hypothetical protein
VGERQFHLGLTSSAQSGFSISSGTTRIFDIGYGLSGLQFGTIQKVSATLNILPNLSVIPPTL